MNVLAQAAASSFRSPEQRRDLHEQQQVYVGDAAFTVDALAIVIISIAICLSAQHLMLMSVFVPMALVLRFVVWTRVPADQRDLTLRAEIGFFALCVLLGGFNDWNSVTRHQIYDYNVPVENAAISTIPAWMLLFWGMILRFISSLFRWRRLGLPAPRDTLHFGRRVVHASMPRLLLLSGLVLLTRQLIYRHFAHPIWSWMPFAAAIVVVALVLRPDHRRFLLLTVFGVFGPLVEVLYIHLGGLHVYHLGWLLGVPLWIALWWVLAAFIWDECSWHLVARTRQGF